jgi:Putative esterase
VAVAVGLTSLGLIALLAVLAILLMAGAVTFWHLLARPGMSRFIGRIVLVCALDVVVLGLILAIANRSGGFYASWPELLGTEHLSGRVIALGHGPEVARSLHGHDGQLTVTARLEVAVPGHPKVRGGRLLNVTMTGPVSGITASGYLYVPDAALHQAARRSGLPVIVVISNRIGTRDAAFSARRIAGTAALEIASGRLRPALIVMLPAHIAAGAGRSCLNVPGGPQAVTFFTEDLPQLIRSGFPASTNSAQWAVAGDSTGAYCALQLALTNSAVYSVAAAPPGYYTPQGSPSDVGPSRLLRQQENLIYLLRHEPMQPVTVLLTNGSPAAYQVLDLARAPMRVDITPMAAGQWPLAPVLDRIGRSLGAQP